MGTVIVDGKEVEVGANERLNGIQAAQRAGVEIPHYCWHAGLTVVASCRMCLVESGTKDAATGKISMMPKLVPACQTPAKDGTVFVTNSKLVENARAMVEEDLLLRHPVDCPICDKAGECSLQDYHFKYGREERRADIKPFNSRRRPLGETVTLFVDRCVMCTRCVRFTREISGTSELMVTNRGAHEEIDVFPGFPLDNKMSGNVVDLCPVGALGDVDFLYKQRVWFMRSHDNVCSGCSTGCSIKIEENQDRLYRLKPRENPHINQWWMCDEGRYGWKHVHDAARTANPKKRYGAAFVDLEWHETGPQIDAALRGTEGQMAMVLSPFLTVEEAYLAAKYARSIDDGALLVLGPIPVVGEDEKFPSKFVISAEKCPNRRGVEEVIAALSGNTCNWPEFVERTTSTPPTRLWLTGGYPTVAYDVALAMNLAQTKILVVQDMFESPLWENATFQLPGVSFAERAGSYVNRDDRLQTFSWAIRPPAGAKTDGQVFWPLAGYMGLYSAPLIRKELAQLYPFFSAAGGEIGPHGISLKSEATVDAVTTRG
jgi:NADH-quinone oxidoreductase subunit G